MPIPDTSLRMSLWHQFLGSFASPTLDFPGLVEASSGVTGALIEQVCIDAKRVAVLNGEPLVDEAQLFRRLGLALALLQGAVLSTTQNEIHWLKTWAPKRFSLRALAKLYNMSNRNVTNILREKKDSGQEKGQQSLITR